LAFDLDVFGAVRGVGGEGVCGVSERDLVVRINADLTAFRKAFAAFGVAYLKATRTTLPSLAAAGDVFWALHYHDDLCGMNDDTEDEVFV
jgi:hypothetical protein